MGDEATRGEGAGEGAPRPGPRAWPVLTVLAVAAVLTVVGFAYRHRVGEVWHEESVRSWAQTAGPAAPLVTIALGAAQVIVAPLPGQLVGIVNGYLFGPWLGTLYSMIGLVIGTAAAMALGRRFGRPLVERFVPPERLERWDRIGRRHGPLFFFLVFLFPFVPDDIACFVMGLSRLPFWPMVGLAALGRLPGMIVAAWAGASVGDLPPWAYVVLGVASLVLAVVFIRFSKRLEGASIGLARYLDRRARSKRRRAEERRRRERGGSTRM